MERLPTLAFIVGPRRPMPLPRAVRSTGGRSTLRDTFEPTLRAARAGADEAWARIYRDLSGPLLGYLRAQRAPDPEDLVGEVMLQLVRDLDSFEGDEEGFRAWAFTIAHRRLVDARRRAGRRPSSPAPTEQIEPALPPSDGEPEALQALTTDEILALLDRLTPDQREVMVLRLVVGLRGSEIAEITGRDLEAVKGLARRAIDRLRQIIGGAEARSAPVVAHWAPPNRAAER